MKIWEPPELGLHGQTPGRPTTRPGYRLTTRAAAATLAPHLPVFAMLRVPGMLEISAANSSGMLPPLQATQPPPSPSAVGTAAGRGRSGCAAAAGARARPGGNARVARDRLARWRAVRAAGVRAAGAGAGALRVLGEGAAELHHEAVDDAMEGEAIVVA
eukprot:scaffold370_cov289-Prasinococcus_capsulatus_cf.AAC.2